MEITGSDGRSSSARTAVRRGTRDVEVLVDLFEPVPGALVETAG